MFLDSLKCSRVFCYYCKLIPHFDYGMCMCIPDCSGAHSFLQVTIKIEGEVIICLLLPPSPDAIPVAVQPTGEAAVAEMVYATNRAGEEEGDPGHDDAGAGPSTAFLQLPPVEGHEDRLQEVECFIVTYCM